MSLIDLESLWNEYEQQKEGLFMEDGVGVWYHRKPPAAHAMEEACKRFPREDYLTAVKMFSDNIGDLGKDGYYPKTYEANKDLVERIENSYLSVLQELYK